MEEKLWELLYAMLGGYELSMACKNIKGGKYFVAGLEFGLAFLMFASAFWSIGI